MSEHEARRLLREIVHVADTNHGMWAPMTQPIADARAYLAAPAADDGAEALAAALEGLLAGGRHEGLCDPPDAKGGCRIHLHNSWEREAVAEEAVRVYRAAHPKAPS